MFCCCCKSVPISFPTNDSGAIAVTSSDARDDRDGDVRVENDCVLWRCDVQRESNRSNDDCICRIIFRF